MAQGDRGVAVTLVPLADLADAIGPMTELVVVSAVQSATGELADLDAIERAAREHGARTLIDATQACGWLPIDARRFDYLTCAAYKWLLSPRGAAFMTVRPERLVDVRPNAAGWYAGADIWSSIYGAPLRLAKTARRLDVSPAWLCWVGTVPSLELLGRIGLEAIHAHDVALANRVRDGLGMAPTGSAIVCVTDPGAAERLAAAGIRASTRAGAARLSFHLHNTAADADRALEALAAPDRSGGSVARARCESGCCARRACLLACCVRSARTIASRSRRRGSGRAPDRPKPQSGRVAISGLAAFGLPVRPGLR
jgi:selenocysteine lyase/cysteine desulfurase